MKSKIAFMLAIVFALLCSVDAFAAVCQKCLGRGKVRDYFHLRTCKACEGKGKFDETAAAAPAATAPAATAPAATAPAATAPAAPAPVSIAPTAPVAYTPAPASVLAAAAHKCDRCEGRGKIRRYLKRKKCERCNGTGMINPAPAPVIPR
jgi:hypothetical protein